MAGNPFYLLLILFQVIEKSYSFQCEQQACSKKTERGNMQHESLNFVEESPYMISPEDFYHNFVTRHKPLVMRGSTANKWRAKKIQWTADYFINAYKDEGKVSVMKTVGDFPHGPKFHLPINKFFTRSLQEDLIVFDKIGTNMQNNVIVPLCLRCQQFTNKMKVSYWLRHYQNKTSTSLFFSSDETLLTVVNGSVQVVLVSPLHGDKLTLEDKQILGLNNFPEDIRSRLRKEAVPHMIVDVYEGDMLYIPQLWLQLATISASRNLFVQFSWPTKIQTSSHLQPSSKATDSKLQGSHALLQTLLKKHEETYLLLDVPPLNCPVQDMRMSEYVFETGKMPPEEYQAVHNGPDFTEDEPCMFDVNNKQCPCHFAPCLEDIESSVCIRYILEYCNQWEDRGCVIDLPQLLNKVDKHKKEEITSMPSPYS